MGQSIGVKFLIVSGRNVYKIITALKKKTVAYVFIESCKNSDTVNKMYTTKTKFISENRHYRTDVKVH